MTPPRRREKARHSARQQDTDRPRHSDRPRHTDRQQDIDQRQRPDRPRRRTSLRHSLRARLLASSVLVAVCSITATAWLAVQGTSESLSVEQGETLASDTRIHDELVGYAATHPSWEGVDATVQELSEQTGRRIALATENRRPIADSAESGSDSPAALPPRASSVVDPLAVDVTLVPEGVDRIDPRAVGPFALNPEDRARLLELAEEGTACLMELYGITAEVEVGPSGRPSVTASESDQGMWADIWFDCGLELLDEPVGTERDALAALAGLTEPCLDPGGEGVEFRMDGATGLPEAVPASMTPERADPVAPSPADDARAPLEPGDASPPPADPSEEPGSGAGPVEEEWGPVGGNGAPDEAPQTTDEGERALEEEREAEAQLLDEERTALEEEPLLPEPDGAWAGPVSPELDQRSADCVDSARRELLDPHVAPAALLFIDDPAEDPAAGLSLSREGVLRVSSVVLLVLVLTVGVSVTVSTRLARPVRALTGAVLRMRAGEGAGRVEVRDSGELGQLAAAFNEMSEHLERLEEQRKAMVSDVSHELRTPLSNLRGWLEAAQDGVADLQPERMEMLVGETLLLQAIIDDLQDLALADAGKLRLSPEPVEAGSLVEQVVASHRLRADEAGLRLIVEADGVVLRADRTRLAQAVGNLVGNALRHTSAPGTVTVRARREGPDAVIEVADTGAGIAPEDLPQVFDRFWRAEKSRSRQTGGSGLGLAIVRNLAELHGGSITVESTLGVGSTFTLRLPLSGPERTRTPTP
ncbi:two-component system sensor histidine kinase BaeS [Nocardiopsis sp. Huas11]|uniref:sensor histidine kinase n=1 Tax=Nocardiopsis sp. Huas11 TaxID=2183912 RepID=UPI000EB58BC2|nr:HAMP domain-containing sensor histidine kinase [Nocardiopsis sp. Huas11]RKS05915.1 two-component system sensor histidine kinase BaeS [Nocardiopsis sp. Huas11]